VGEGQTLLTANFGAQYLLNLSVNPTSEPGSISASPFSADRYFDSGRNVRVTAIPTNTNGVLDNFYSDIGQIFASEFTIAMNAPHSVLATFGTFSVSPQSLNFAIGKNHSPSPAQIVSIYSSSPEGWAISSNQPNIKVSPGSGLSFAGGYGYLSFSFQVSVTDGPSGTLTLSKSGSTTAVAQIPVDISRSDVPYPFGSFDTPADSASGISGAVAVTGWALSDDGQVTEVDIWREPMASEPTASNGLIYIGDATFVPGARPDVVSAFPNTPNNNRAGWGYLLLTTFLPNNVPQYVPNTFFTLSPTSISFH
jgi:hypothetical protein